MKSKKRRELTKHLPVTELDFKLHRAGISMQRSNDKAPFTACSIFWPRYKATGMTVDEAYSNYLKTVQEPEMWRGVADELFRHVKAYHYRFFSPIADTPMSFWNELVDCVLPRAYEPPMDKELVNRVYAYSEWCFAQIQDEPFDGEPAEHFRTCVTICFYESLAWDPSTLADMPNWFAYSELDELMFKNRFMEEDVPAIKGAFGVA